LVITGTARRALRKWYLPFDPKAYGGAVADLLALDGDGSRLIPLVAAVCASDEANRRLSASSPSGLFPHAFSPEGAFAGMWLYFSCFEQCHAIAQDLHTAEGSFWHGILHRQEPDSGNAAYWFRRAGHHAVFPALHHAAQEIVEAYPAAEFRPGPNWDPFAFIMFCERARQQPGSPSERAALEIQRAEWQLLFDYCARPRR
jgi:hypothetical protein